MSKGYRTLVAGRLRQRSALTVGGSVPEPGGADVSCARDGRGRLTIPGTALAGCLIDTAARVFPALFDQVEGRRGRWGRITGKTKMGVAHDREVLQSLWRFSPAHLAHSRVERRQGVGIRHETGATAAEAGALFDLETVPAGACWDLFLEIDARRAGREVEAAALYALSEWIEGRCWLGASAARGLGWLALEEVEILRLPATEEVLTRWPDSSRDRDDLVRELRNLKGVEPFRTDEVRGLAGQLWPDALGEDRAWHVVLEGELVAGKTDWGLDALSVGGHAAGLLAPTRGGLCSPPGMRREDYLGAYAPDAPVVTTGREEEPQRPLVPGSGIRGPLRHAASRLARASGNAIPDPSVNRPDAPGRREGDASDPVSRLFGLVERSAALLVRDAEVKGDYSLACMQHHAEDEFAAGVFGSGKFDRTVVLEGRFLFELALQAKTAGEMAGHLEALRSALCLAELGFVPVGGAKTRGAGWVKWQFNGVRSGRAGDPGQHSPVAPATVGQALNALLGTLRGKSS